MPTSATGKFLLEQALNCYKTGQFQKAKTYLERVLAMNPGHVASHLNLANVLHQLGEKEKALHHFDQAIVHQPGDADLYNQRGNVLRELHQYEDALASYDQALACDGALNAESQASIHNNRAIVLHEMGQLEEAQAAYEQALAVRPHYPLAYYNQGNLWRDGQRFDEALASYQKAVELDPAYADAYWVPALVWLLQGQLQKGFERYEWRWKRPGFTSPKRSFSQPLWLGQFDLKGKIILLHGEQGLGDTLQFARYVPLVAHRGARVVLEVQDKTLLPLFETIPLGVGAQALYVMGQKLPAFDCHCPLMSLPLAFQTTLDTIPAESAYFQVRPVYRRAWAKRIERLELASGLSRRPRVGLVWQGSPGHSADHKRSVSLSLLLPYLAPLIPQVTFVCLQKEISSADAVMLKSHGLSFWGSELRSFADTAALCQEMDLVISIDTSVAHLAGTLGRPTWVLLPHTPDWRWLLDRPDSPWYPCVRLYRQGPDRRWESVLAQVASDLVATVATVATFSWAST